MFAQGDVADTLFYLQKGKVKLSVLSKRGKEAVVGILQPGQFFGEGSLDGHRLRISTATSMEDCVITAITKYAMLAALHDEPRFSEMFMAHLLTRKPLCCKRFGACWERLGSLAGGESGRRTPKSCQ